MEHVEGKDEKGKGSAAVDSTLKLWGKEHVHAIRTASHVEGEGRGTGRSGAGSEG